MVQKVQAYIVEYNMIKKDDCVIVGVSGGADSMCLLSMLQMLSPYYSLRIHVVHVNHQMRIEAEEEAEFVENYCRKYEIPFHYASKDVKAYATKYHLSTEEAGRKIRYHIFEELYQELSQEHTCKIAVGHNQNDRAETMIFRLARGTGLTGLKSIVPCRGNIIRPILCLNRGEVEQYLEEKNLDYCIDKSNLTDDYTRNQIRHHIIPKMEQMNQKAIEHMNDTASKLEQVEIYLMKQVAAILDICAKNEHNQYHISVEILKEYDLLLQQYAIREVLYQLSRQRNDFTTKHINSVLELSEKSVGKYVTLPYDLIGKREYHAITIYKRSKEEVEKSDLYEVVLQEVPNIITLQNHQKMSFKEYQRNEILIIEEKKYTKYFDYDKIENMLSIRTRKKDDYIALNTIHSKKLLRRYMIEYKIPKEERDYIILLADGSHILWVVGGRMSECYKVTPETKRILEVTIWKDT